MKLSRTVSLLLAACLITSTAASCGSKQNEEVKTSTALEDLSAMSYDEKSAAFYENTLGEFKAMYDTAKEATNISERYALMALAEAKLLESAVMLPTTTNGGNYAISRVAPYTVDFALWGNDSYRYHQALVVTEPIATVDRDAMKIEWGKLKGKGEYLDWARDYLEGKGYVLKDSYSLAYSSDPETWDVLATSRAADSEAIINTYDGLMEYDVEGILQPALAESYTVSEDGLTYTFKLRSGAVWTDSQGRKVADVKADDFVAGMQHMMDAAGGLEYLVQGIIVGATEYIDGAITDFSKVGVKAIDDLTVEYTLEAPCSYFTTMLGYGVFAPMSREYYTSQGGKFGSAYDASAASYKYGTTPNNIAYCGPYLVTNATAKNTIVFKASDSYWNKDGINIKTLTWLYNDGSDTTKGYNDMKSGVLDGSGLDESTIELAKQDGLFDKFKYVTSTDATSFMAFFNVNREQFANINDETKVVSPQTEEQRSRTYIAMNNIHFRRALSMSLDRGAYNAQSVGEDLKLLSLRNSYTPYNFVYLEEDVTIEINGKNKKFKAGTCYGEIMQAQIDADNVNLVIYDPKADNGAGSGDGYDGWYNPENAKAEFEVAAKQLAEAGFELSAANPVYIDYPYYSGSSLRTNMANVVKQSIEEASGGLIVINLVDCKDSTEWYYAGYYTNYGYEANYDIYDVSGWGPDYGDPATYLDTFLDEYAGYMIKCIGIY